MARNVYEAFERKALKLANQDAIRWRKDGRWVNISYGELLDRVGALSSLMRGQYGIRKGDRAAIALGNRPEWPAVFFALLHAGAVPVPVNEHGSPDDLGRILADAGCSIAFTGKGCPALNVRSVAADSDGFWSALSAPSREKYGAGARRDDIACIMYTSGTSSHPKGVVMSHGNLLSNMH